MIPELLSALASLPFSPVQSIALGCIGVLWAAVAVATIFMLSDERRSRDQ